MTQNDYDIKLKNFFVATEKRNLAINESASIQLQLPSAVNDWQGWRQRVRDIRADTTTRWWWWYVLKIDLALNNLQRLICHKT